MDTTKQPGISVDNISLLDASIGDLNCTEEVELRYSLGLTGFNRTETDNELYICLGLDLFKGVAKPPFKFSCSFSATYKRSEDAAMQWSEFSDAVAIAHVIPYFREFITNMTSRLTVYPSLYLDPVNTFLLLEAYEEDLKIKTKPKSPSKKKK